MQKISLQGGKKVKDGQKYPLELVAAKVDQEIQVHVSLNSPESGYRLSRSCAAAWRSALFSPVKWDWTEIGGYSARPQL